MRTGMCSRCRWRASKRCRPTARCGSAPSRPRSISWREDRVMGPRIRLKDFADARTTADAVYEALRQAILAGELAPGRRLRSDALAGELNVSRTPVREALRKLEAEGLVEASGSALGGRQ